MGTPPASRLNPKRSLVLGPAQDAILRALFRYHLLSSRQICRLFYSPRSLGYVQTLLKDLADAGYCQRSLMPRLGRSGSSPLLYTIGRRGLNYLADLGLEVNARFHPSEESHHALLFVAHSLAVVDVLISLELLVHQSEQIALEVVVSERELKRQPSYVKGPTGGKVAVIPDAYVDLRVNGVTQVCLALECDRATEEQRKWRQKVFGHVAWSKGPYQERFNAQSLTIVVTAPSPKRLLDLLQWTEAELKTLGEEREADLYRFTCVSPVDADPIDYFVSGAHWYQPFGYRPGAVSGKPSLATYQSRPLLQGVI